LVFPDLFGVKDWVDQEVGRVNGETVIWGAGIFCVALYFVALTLPPDKPKRSGAASRPEESRK